MTAAELMAADVLAPELLGWAVEALVASALLMAAVLLARGAVRRAFGPQVAYALWALPALRLLMPPLPAGWREQAAMPITRASEAVTVLIVPIDAPVAAVATPWPWAAMLATVWVMGAIAFFGHHFLSHRRFCRRLLGEARLLDEVEGVRVVESAAASGPLAFGVARRFVAFPRDFADRYDADERELALAHELGHHARCDLLANWVALAVLALHWFNPLAWRAFRAFRCDQELANDARVLAGRSRTDRHIYACAIVKAAHGGAVSAACHLHTIADLKGRLKMLTNSKLSKARLAAGSAAVLALVATGLVATASGTQAAAAVGERIGDAVGVDLRTPQAAVAPVAPVAATAPRTVKRVVVVKNGKTRTYEGAAADAYAAAHALPVPPVPPRAPQAADGPAVPPTPLPPLPPIGGEVTTMTSSDGKTYRVMTRGGGERFTMMAPPEVLDRECRDGRDGGPRQFVLQRTDGDKRVMIVCTNRINKAAREGAEAGMRSSATARMGLRTALASIATARASIAANRDLSEEQRREALAGLDQAQAEVREEIGD